MKKVARLTAQGVSIGMMNVKGEDYISLTDIARLKNAEFPADVVRNWMRSVSGGCGSELDAQQDDGGFFGSVGAVAQS